MVAFSTAEGASTFMVARGEIRWEFLLVNRSTFPPLVPRLKGLGAKGLCLNPGAGRRGVSLSLEEVAPTEGSPSGSNPPP